LGAKDYDLLYDDFEALLSLMQSDELLKQQCSEVDTEFAQSADYKLYGQAPVGFVDESKSGKSKKVYFHYSTKYHHYIREHHTTLLKSYPTLNQFLDKMARLCQVSNLYFEQAITALERKCSDLRKTMYENQEELATIVKVVRYEPAEVVASNPHYDFSGLSILIDNSDKDEETLLLSPYKDNISPIDFQRPKREFQRKAHSSSAILIPGLALKYLDLPFNPTPHAVLKQDRRRYAIISFAMVPHISLSYDQIKLRHVNLPKF